MAIQLTTTRQAAQLNGIKVCVYGQAGVGKTTLVATTGGSPVIISAESGLLSLRGHEIPTIIVRSLEDVTDAYNFIVQSSEAAHFDWVCLDSLSEIAEVVLSAEKALTKDPRQAYGALQDRMTSMIRAFRDLPGRNVYFSAKQERIKDDATGALFYSPSMPGARLGQGLAYFFDEVFCLRVENNSEGVPVRMLQTSGDYNYIAKDRSGALAMFEHPNLAAIRDKILAQPQPAAQATQQSNQ